jgi:hypothetical protein
MGRDVSAPAQPTMHFSGDTAEHDSHAQFTSKKLQPEK